MAETAQLPYTIVDAFTTDVFRGNPAAVLVLERELPDATMQLIAREFNLSDTAFIARTADPSVFGMRWFTPGQEVTLCGHATLASVHVLNLPRVTFKTRFAGDITATKAPDGTVELEFPAGVSQRIETEGLEAKVANALRTACALPATPKINYVGTPPDPAFKGYLLVHIDDDIELESLKVDTGFLAAELPYLLQIITNAPPAHFKADGKHFVCRVFAAAAGVPEDPVCGSAHCVLTPYWTTKLGVEGTLASKQVSARTGDLYVEWKSAINTVSIRGKAVTAASGVLSLPAALL